MTHTVIEIVQTNNDAEPSFEVWQCAYPLAENRYRIAYAPAVPGPDHWPVPADPGNYLSHALKWYFEDYILNPAPERVQQSKNVLKALYDWGKEVYRLLFNTEVARKGYTACTSLPLDHETRIEIHSRNTKILSWPWEALIDPGGEHIGALLSVERIFTGAGPQENVTQQPQQSKKLDVLLVTARSRTDIDYRLIGRILSNAGAAIRLTLLNPPTLNHLKEILAGPERFDVVHFDCHGIYEALDGVSHAGYLLLEQDNTSLIPVSADQLSDALGPDCPAHIVMNACRSAMSGYSPHNDAFSLATKLLLHPGITDVTAMAYNLSVEAAEHFVRNYYTGLLRHFRPGYAVRMGKMSMRQEPARSFIGGTVNMMDWVIPVFYRKYSLPGGEVIRTAEPGNLETLPMVTLDDCIGRDKFFYHLDRLSNLKQCAFFIFGLAGAGKTMLIKAYLTWRKDTGDQRGSSWIDFEKCQNLTDVLRTLAGSLAAEKDMVPYENKKALQSFILTELAIHPRWVMMDNIQEANAPFSDAKGFRDTDRSALSQLIGEITATGSVVIASGRGKQSWLHSHSRVIDLPMTGLNDIERWQFINKWWESEYPDPAVRAAAEQSENYKNLLFFLAGHPVMTAYVLGQLAKGKTANDYYHQFRNGGFNFSAKDKSCPPIQRIMDSGRVFQDDDVRQLAPFLIFHQELIDEFLLKEMLTLMNLPDPNEIADAALQKLEFAGLLFDRWCLHPVAGCLLRNEFNPDHYKEHAAIFLKVLFRAVDNFYEDRYDKTINLSMGTIETGIRQSLKLKRFDQTVFLAKYYIQFCSTNRKPAAKQKFLLLYDFFFSGGELVHCFELMVYALRLHIWDDFNDISYWLHQAMTCFNASKGILQADQQGWYYIMLADHDLKQHHFAGCKEKLAIIESFRRTLKDKALLKTYQEMKTALSARI
ncbi:CHAT domain-containing protein [Mucilaginibacter sabulilitoris]|uniref:CHAT domain-containing protein n=1 Tax=Mucilaginibacter sabulilitoris TaxID=1173583 RepID=A0ABZ0TVC9_9SPHI|nr:CHAT domain-containing protein [Mucilaginibacter sabulilitoris]WPU97037.1 CHAT domain-containing protein [Mucilaginibacter sabulilitoris]